MNHGDRSILDFYSPRLRRRQFLKASLIGVGGLAAATVGLTRLATLIAASPGLGRWRRLTPKTIPSVRFGAVMAFDGARGAPILFSEGQAAEAWAWNGSTWLRERPPLSPPARAGARISYHPPTKTIVLFGGTTSQGFLGDTWLWNGRTWNAVLGAGPRARANASMAFDPGTGSLILFGGYGDGLLGDTWKWDGRAWRALSPSTSPPPLSGTSSAYSAALGKLILFGGSPFQMAGGGSDVTWAWDGMNWSRISFDSSPPGRFFAAMAADPEGKLVLLFGGSGESLLGDTWTLASRWSADTRSPAPPPRAGASLVPDPSSNSFLLFGGGDGSGRVLNDTWAWGPI